MRWSTYIRYELLATSLGSGDFHLRGGNSLAVPPKVNGYSLINVQLEIQRTYYCGVYRLLCCCFEQHSKPKFPLAGGLGRGDSRVAY